jgi:hypothetical protein
MQILIQGGAAWVGREVVGQAAARRHLVTRLAVVAAGLRHRSRAEPIADTSRWERTQGLDWACRAGLSATRERELLNAFARAGE